MEKTKCFYCKKEIAGRHIIDGNLHFCDDYCADEDWRGRGADAYAYHESDGLFSNFEDYAESLGCTIISHYEEDQPLYLHRRER